MLRKTLFAAAAIALLPTLVRADDAGSWMAVFTDNSEPLNHGMRTADVIYLPFASKEECVSAASRMNLDEAKFMRDDYQGFVRQRQGEGLSVRASLSCAFFPKGVVSSPP